ncbi:MAG: phospho-N-acetylmuramoyl-pentapeptide-transferase [Bifidobacteriaceae bacterium]|jgi:phospho-N-acetylmuramoyl-pentapeptide-transferase|nr:phospho-N-acetylmuramoyl-pentapeptide-transferase [Bifidobacteriaceae bacterium]
MLNLLFAAAIALMVTGLGTPLFIRFLVRRQFGQFIRQDGPTTHHTKRGTPTMGGIVIIVATGLGYAGSNLATGRSWHLSGLSVLFLMAGLGFVGFLDDYTKIRRQRSLGLKPLWKIVGQGIVGVTFALLVAVSPGGREPVASTAISILRDTKFDLAFAGRTIGIILFVLWANFLITAWSNAVNLTDGLDGLATGTSAMTFGAYILVTFWQINRWCGQSGVGQHCYIVNAPLDIAVVAAAVVGACLGFLWWNTSPAKIFMGDTGSLALGGAFAGLSIVTRTELLAVIIGGLFVVIVLSSVIQIISFRSTGKRVFKMAPLHHHFELSGWGEVTIVIRFWLIAILFAAAGVGLFYAESLPG